MWRAQENLKEGEVVGNRLACIKRLPPFSLQRSAASPQPRPHCSSCVSICIFLYQ